VSEFDGEKGSSSRARKEELDDEEGSSSGARETLEKEREKRKKARNRRRNLQKREKKTMQQKMVLLDILLFAPLILLGSRRSFSSSITPFFSENCNTCTGVLVLHSFHPFSRRQKSWRREGT
jgi:uncharacterized membrane protein (DUF106 family)